MMIVLLFMVIVLNMLTMMFFHGHHGLSIRSG